LLLIEPFYKEANGQSTVIDSGDDVKVEVKKFQSPTGFASM